jgi:hypothetical protein
MRWPTPGGNIEDSSMPWRGHETGAQGVPPTHVAQEGTPTSPNGRPKRRPRSRDMQDSTEPGNTAWSHLSTVSKKTCEEMQGVHGHRGGSGRSQRLPGAKKDPQSRLFRGLSKIPVSGQPSKGEGSLPCRLFPSDLLCQALRKSTCVKFQNLDPKISNHAYRLNTTKWRCGSASHCNDEGSKTTCLDSFWRFASRPDDQEHQRFSSSADGQTAKSVDERSGVRSSRSHYRDQGMNTIEYIYRIIGITAMALLLVVAAAAQTNQHSGLRKRCPVFQGRD